ncbi:WD40 repeat and BING4, C-terminal domain and WD40/YVTN repeat-like-containing domain and WD40-repeat-containing domain-containing protein [Strongyloides ratti]|uniref:WD40 repeat and BING4, C-terminal domain and WD40/YVTN repeat-like-containing domain and WD40-repeat-containing domain-containing protein n=1 Tax=Strongyloides ratti TaxID=34506 RepID=A0A090L956_STRRB|nr:WD40 repeat and BING4, C-terminal domain and WD40/YVTN repeat-like-containing domain and WD40-repeat-containing domain-containing protein [Strongyloides ratti]CEF66267.1 WD40 repeat and BING4, C-terminal domain and WD40/YVTN repeat-like-containing domain and WD40-repeat-containing domain-containing protein [Strongyloides ratti]
MSRYYNTGQNKIKKSKTEDPFPGVPEVSEEQKQKHDEGTADLDENAVKTGLQKKKFRTKKQKIASRAEFMARAEIMNKEEDGYIEIDEDDQPTFCISQRDIKILDKYGPYNFDFTPNGRHLVIGGRVGHLASFDWMTKKLHCEINTREEIRCVKWLHNEQLFAAGQLRWTHIYDRQGIEIHCLKQLDRVISMEFLPRHFLLVTGNQKGFLSYLDVTMGKMVSQFQSRQGSLNSMSQNPSNAIILTGAYNGKVAMWSPNVKEPLVEMLAHKSNVSSICVDQTGTYLATAGADKFLRIWDIRNLTPLHAYKLPSMPSCLAFSQKTCIAVGSENIVNVYNDSHLGTMKTPYLRYKCTGAVNKLQFCPYEDVLGVGHSTGYTSLLIPGSGDPNFDGYKVNPFETKKQRQEREVRQLLDKIQPEFITLDSSEINKVNTEKLEDTFAYRAKILRVKAEVPKYIPRKKARGKSKVGKHEQRKQGMKSQLRSEIIQKKKQIVEELGIGKKD